MNPYTLAAVVVVAIAAVAIVFMRRFDKTADNTKQTILGASEEFGNTARHTANEVKQAIVGTAEEAGETVRHTVNMGAEVIAPLVQAASNIGNAISDKLRVGYKEMKTLTDEVNRLELELQQIKSRRINVSYVEAELKLAFFKVKFSHREFVDGKVKVSRKTFFKQQEVIRYVGLFRADYEQHLGVDLADLRFSVCSPSLSGPGLIEVSGLGKTETLGIKDLDIEPEHFRLERYLSNGTILPDKSEIIRGDPDGILDKEKDKHYKRILAAVNSDKSVQDVDMAVERMALEFLRLSFSTAGYRVKKANKALSKGKNFYEVCEELKALNDANIANKTAAIGALFEKKEAVAKMIDSQLIELKELPKRLTNGSA